MILPFRTSIRPYRTPYVNYALIIINVAIFTVTYYRYQIATPAGIVEEVLRPWAQPFMYDPHQPYLWQFVSYAFLHSSLMHIAGNMYFLYLFGNNVNDKLGNLGYLCFYLAGAVFSAIGHSAFHLSPVIGASGAVAAVTGAYLVLFPQTLVTVVYWFLFIGTMELPALYFIGLKMILLDNVIARGPYNIAYDAHLAGYAFGILAIILLLATNIIKSHPMDLWAMLKRWNQRRLYRDVVSSGYDPYTGTNVKKVKAKQARKTPAELAREKEIMQLRSEISEYIAQGNLTTAADLYQKLLEIDPKQILPRQQLLDIANQLMTHSQHTKSAAAYEKFLASYSKYEYAEQIQLMLGILYSRYLKKSDLAEKYLKLAVEKLSDPGQIKMCDEELARLEKG